MKDAMNEFSQLSPVKQALLQKLLREKLTGQSTPLDRVIRRHREGENVPLSFAQQRLWFEDQLQPESTAYVEANVLQISGSLNMQVLEQSLMEVIRRHEVLRTVFVNSSGHPIQVIRSSLSLAVPVIDLALLSTPEQKDTISQLARQEAHHRFDLDQGPLLRMVLLCVKDDECILIVTFHHIICDAWSAGLFIRELSKIYTAFSGDQLLDRREQALPLPDLAVQYADFAVWQRECLQEGRLEQQLSYWVNQLDGTRQLEFPTDHPRPPVQTFHGAHQSRFLPPSLIEKLKDLSQREGTTLFTTLLAAFQTLLFRYTGQTDVVVGTTVASRSRPEFQGLIGLFVNTLVMRTDLSNNSPFRTLLKDVQQRVIEAITNQDIPFEEVVARIQPERQLSHSPIFQIEITLRDPLPTDLHLGDTLVTLLPVESGIAKLDLAVEMIERGRGLDIRLEYNTDLFNTATMERLLGNWQTLLEAIVQDPEQRVQALPLLTVQEYDQLTVQWNATVRDFPYDLCLHQLVEQQVEQTPEAVAVVFGETSLTYRELNRQANHLATRLLEEGVGPECLVGIYMERSPWMLISILAISKAGGVYLPLDIAHPEQRIRSLVAEARVHVILTQRSLPIPLQQEPLRVITVESVWERERLEPSSYQELSTRNHAENLAYVIYTSGSTGLPKGAMVTQRGMVNHLFAKVFTLQLKPTEKIAQTASASFDISVWQFLAALLVGGQVCILPDHVAHDPDLLFTEVSKQGITVLEVVPSLLQAALNDLMEPDEQRGSARLLFGPAPSNLHWIVVTGEACPTSLIDRWGQCYPHASLLNAYGPTECSDDVTHAVLLSTIDMERSYRTGARHSPYGPIGSPIANTQVYILDTQMQLLPIGVPGEIYIGGIGVGRGYLRDPVRTAQAFVPNPFVGIARGHTSAQHEGGRLYRTGDIGRYRDDGQIEFIGRIDQQVKIRGYRIELGEIEATLMKHPEVREAVVLAREDVLEDKCLVAYIVGERSEIQTFSSKLRKYLQNKLPDYMVPAFFVLLDVLPKTPNGKVDRRTLPPPEKKRLRKDESGIAASTQIEEVVLTIYREILEVEQISVHDSFFDLGGHSLLATQVVSRIRTTMGVEIPLHSLFETPSATELAKRIEQNLRREQTSVRPPLVPVAREQDGSTSRPSPLSFAQQRLWFQEQLVSDHSAYVVPLVVKLQGPLHVAVLERCLQELISRHESLRTTVVAHQGQPVQVINSAWHIELATIDLQAMAEDKQSSEVMRLLNTSLHYPFDLSRGPLLQTGLLHLRNQEYILYLSILHIIFDAWSIGILFRELSALYEAFLQGKPSPLEPIALQYVDFAHWQQNWLKGKVLDSLINYWTEHLRGATALEIPTDRPRSTIVDNRGAIYPFKLPAQLWQQLIALSREVGVTLFMTLLATFQILLSRYTEQQDIVIGTDIANRTSAETETMIGFFINLLVLRTQLILQETFRETLKRVRAIVLNAYAHQDLPFEKLVDALQLERNSHQIPLVNVLFVLQNAPQQALELEGLSVSPVDIEIHTAKFDLALFLMERAGEVGGYVNYRTELFNPDTIARFIRHFEVLLTSAVSSPDAPLERLEMLTKEEKEHISNKEILLQETEHRRLKIAKRHLLALPEENSSRTHS